MDVVRNAEREMYLAAYCYALRQLRYDDASPELALAIATAAIKALEASYE